VGSYGGEWGGRLRRWRGSLKWRDISATTLHPDISRSLPQIDGAIPRSPFNSSNSVREALGEGGGRNKLSVR
jgi:hypothetical protein